MTDAEIREAARQFINKWHGKGKEDEDDRSFWLDILTRIMGIPNATDYIDFQKKVVVDGNTKRIDAYIPETKVLIEQKSLGIALDKKGHQSGGIELTPYEQAKRYNDNLPYTEKARWIVTSNFGEIWIYDMDSRVPEPVKLELEELRLKYHMLHFLIKQETVVISKEMELSLQAGELVGKLYDSFLKQYSNPEDPESLKSLNKLCVRIVFCLYAEDAGIFGRKDLFHDYLEQFNIRDLRNALVKLFRVLDQKPEDRDRYLSDDDPLLAAFPYVNGGLFADENIEIPPFTEEIRSLLLQRASSDFDWSQISPTIFGAVFESTLNPETRRSGGMHYTSIENIHKVIDPLFLDELKSELEEIKDISIANTKIKRLEAYQNKLASLSWLDPAAGSGNFLTETYISVRRLENEAIRELLDSQKGAYAGQIVFGQAYDNPIKVSIGQFYGIEINDFAVTVAKTALWIAESQMMKETEDIIHMNLEFLPLKTNAHIVEANALRIDWNIVIPSNHLNYIMGNPPFVGKKEQSKEQKEELMACFDSNAKGTGNLDYVTGWYAKATSYINETSIRCAFVSTNSITQGEQVPIIWEYLLNRGIKIDFAYRTFRWDSEASIKAHVHCVIIGFSIIGTSIKRLFEDKNIREVQNINPYLIEADNIIIRSSSKPICNVPSMSYGSMPIDDNHLILKPEELEEFKNDVHYNPELVRKYIGGDELINNKMRYCLWLKDINPNEYSHSQFVMNRIELTRKFRLSSKRPQTLAAAETPQLFGEIRQPNTEMLVVPKVSSENRRYIPIGFVNPDIIVNGSALIVPQANLYLFGVLISNVHNAWMRVVCGRMKSDYQYSASNVYNNFPFPHASDEQQKRIEKSAQDILDARANYPNNSLADLYGEHMYLYPELVRAHTENDKAVMRAYGFDIKNTSEADCVAALMKMYQELVNKE